MSCVEVLPEGSVAVAVAVTSPWLHQLYVFCQSVYYHLDVNKSHCCNNCHQVQMCHKYWSYIKTLTILVDLKNYPEASVAVYVNCVFSSPIQIINCSSRSYSSVSKSVAVAFPSVYVPPSSAVANVDEDVNYRSCCINNINSSCSC